MQGKVDRTLYFQIRSLAEKNLDQIVTLERNYMFFLAKAIESVAARIAVDFSKATELIPFWINYPPLQRGRAPTGKSVPWLEVGETVISAHVIRAIAKEAPNTMHPGLPSGADIRFMTNEALIHLDVKITGPNDKAEEVVASPNQLSGDGVSWLNDGIANSPVTISGKRSSMIFQPELAPLYILDKRVLPCLTYFLKGVYSVKELGHQPLVYLELICAPNGLMAFTGPDYNKKVPGLYIPGKDVQKHIKKRVRVRTVPLVSLEAWRCKKIWNVEA